MSKLLTPLSIGALELENRIIVAPMCQYSAKDGAPNDWQEWRTGSTANSM